MRGNLFAACRENETLIAKRVQLDAATQQAVETAFTEQELKFRHGIGSEVHFDGRWKPDEDELLTIDVPSEAIIFPSTIVANATSIPAMNAEKFSSEGIRALFTGSLVNGATKVLVQRFTAQQILQRKFSLLQHDNAFRRLTDQAFSLDNSLTCIIEEGKIKFKSQQKLRSIINMLDIYRAATDQEVQMFANHEKLHVVDIAEFLQVTTQTTRKLIHALYGSRMLDNFSVSAIQAAAQQTGLPVHVREGKIIMPTDRKEIKNLLEFLNERRFLGPLSGQIYVSNSQRVA
jgi:hypothetical protein